MSDLDTTEVPDYRARGRLDGRTFLVIGGGQGIGRQAAHALTQHGARCAIVGRSAEMTSHVAGEVGGIALLGDATSRADMERIVGEAEAWGKGLHGLVDTLGMVRRKPLLDFTDEDWSWQFDIVVRHAMLATQIGGKAIARAGGGAMVFVGSTAGLTGSDNHSAYGAAKAALHHMIATAALELGPLGVRINVVAPSVVRTPRVQAYLDSGHGTRAVDYFPLGRLAVPADVAGAILFMASDLSGTVTGQTLLADSGLLVQSPMPDSIWFEKA